MPVTRHHISRGGVRDEHIPSAEIPYGDMKTDAIQIVIPFQMLPGFQTLSADSVGVKIVPWSDFTPPTNMFKHLKSAQVAIAYTWAATADGVIRLYDIPAGVVRGSSTTKTGGESSPFESFDVTGLVEGNMLRMEVNITVAGAAGETVSLAKAYLILTLGVS